MCIFKIRICHKITMSYIALMPLMYLALHFMRHFKHKEIYYTTPTYNKICKYTRVKSATHIKKVQPPLFVNRRTILYLMRDHIIRALSYLYMNYQVIMDHSIPLNLQTLSITSTIDNSIVIFRSLTDVSTIKHKKSEATKLRVVF